VERKGTHSPAQLGLKLVKRLNPKVELSGNDFGRYSIRRTELCTVYAAEISRSDWCTIDRKLLDGRVLRHLHKQGQQVRLVGLKFPVTVSWYYLKRDKGKLEKRFVLSTRAIKASFRWWGGVMADRRMV